MAKEMYAVIYLFQGIVHEIKIFPEWDKAREAADKKIIEAYGELVEEQCGDDEILLEAAQVEEEETEREEKKGILLDKAEIKAALIDRLEQDGLSVQPCVELDQRVEDFYLFVEEALTEFLDDQYNMFLEDQEDEDEKEE
jgi:hypothetical protein